MMVLGIVGAVSRTDLDRLEVMIRRYYAEVRLWGDETLVHAHGSKVFTSPSLLQRTVHTRPARFVTFMRETRRMTCKRDTRKPCCVHLDWDIDYAFAHPRLSQLSIHVTAFAASIFYRNEPKGYFPRVLSHGYWFQQLSILLAQGCCSDTIPSGVTAHEHKVSAMENCCKLQRVFLSCM